MFDNLLKIVRKKSDRTPLEDYTTELLVGVLNNLPKLKRDFCREFLGLKSDYFTIRSQVRYGKSIIDIVIKGKDEVCFIENKVDSAENVEQDRESQEKIRQLDKYCLILDGFSNDGYTTKLVYCTKKPEPKTLIKHSFESTRWYKIAHFLEKNSSEKLVVLFLDFLKQKNMSYDMKLYTKDVLALENFGRIFQIMNTHMERAKEEFEKIFSNVKDLRRGKNFEYQCETHNRFCIYSENPVEGEGWSEILFGFDFSGSIITQLFIHTNNPSYKSFKNILDAKNLDEEDYQIEHYEGLGSKLFFKKNLGEYINIDESEDQIENWFKESFKKIDAFRNDTLEEIKWKKT